MSDALAAAALLQGLTAQYLTTDAYRIEPGDWVVVHAAAGGAGRLVTQFAKLRGAHVLATTSTEEKAEPRPRGRRRRGRPLRRLRRRAHAS